MYIIYQILEIRYNVYILCSFIPIGGVMMPAQMDFGLYFNLLFVVILAFGMLVGFLRGMKKSIYSFLVKLIFVAFFFLTLDMVVNTLWTLNMPFLGGALGAVFPAAAGATSLSDALPIVLQSLLGDNLSTTLTNQEFLDFVGGLAMFVLKIAYMILYFSVIQIFYRIIMFIVRMIIFSKSTKTMAGRSVGALFGGLSALITIYVTIIMLGGIMSISESLVELQASRNEYNYLKSQEEVILDEHFGEIETLNELVPGGQDLDEAVEMLKDFVDGYNANVFVQIANYVTLEDEKTGQDVVLNIYLFDSVFSFNYREQQVSFRKELVVLADMANIILETDYMETQNISDISGDNVRAVFGKLSESDLFAVLIPLMVEVGADYLETEISVPRDELYAIDWGTEINQIGNIAGTVFDIIHAAGYFNDNFELETATFDGDQFSLLFEHLADSDLITLGAYVALEPLMQQLSEDVALIITVPTDLTNEDTWREAWADEFRGLGEVVKAILDTDVTYGQLSSGEPMTLISALSQFDFTKLLDSQIISYGLINILDGTAGIEGFDMIVVEDDVIWLDTYDDVSGDLVPGELRNILVSFNQLAQLANTIDFDNLDLDAILQISMEDIDVILNSKLLAQTFGAMIIDLLEEQEMLVIPRLVIEEIMVKGEPKEIVIKPEIRALFAAVFTLEFDDLEELDFDPSILKRLAAEDDATKLDLDKRDDLFGSHIIHATISKFIIDLMEGEGQTLTVPYVNEDNEPIRHYKNALGDVVQTMVTGHDTEYISVDEFTAVLEAILVLDFDDFDDIASLDIQRVIDNIDALLESAILHATVSNLLIDASADNDTIVVPHFDSTETVEIRKTVGEPDKETTYIIRDELESIFNALDILEISLDDFEGDFDFDLTKLQESNDDITPVLDSAIIHATISKIMLNLRDDDTVIIPEKGLIGDTDTSRDIVVSSGVIVDETYVEFVIKEEIQAIINGLIILGMTDFDSFDGSFNLGALMEDDNAEEILKSAVVHATITRTFLDLGDDVVVIPDVDANGDSIFSIVIAYTVEDGPDQPYILKQELYAIIDVLELLGLGDSSLDGDFDLDLKLENIFGENKTTLLESAVIHATITKQLNGLSGDTIVIPEVDSEGNDIYLDYTAYTEIIDEGLPTEETVEVKYISSDEIFALIDVLELLGLGDASLDDFDIDIKLDVLFDDPLLAPEDQNKVTFLKSAVIHATITKQLLGLGSDVLVIPEEDADGISIRSIHIAYEDVDDNPRRYITKDEVYALIDILELLGLGDSSLDNFDLDIKLEVLFDETNGTPNKEIFLNSASIHATITKQLIELGSDTLVIPETDDSAVPVSLRTAAIAYTDDDENPQAYIIKDEVYALIDVLDILGLGDSSLDNFDINIELSVLFGETEGTPNKDIFLESASIHATITKQLVELGQDTLVIPNVDEDDNDVRSTNIAYVQVIDDGITVEEIDQTFISKDEIKALIDVLEILGLGTSSLDNFDVNIELSVLFGETEGTPNKDIFLESASIHATITKQLLDLGQATLVVPEEDSDGNSVRSTSIAYSEVIDEGLLTEETVDRRYITKDEVKALIDVLEILGLGDSSLDNFDVNIELSVLFGETEGTPNKDIFLESASIHATITKQLLDLGQATLVIPDEDSDGVSIRSTSIAYSEIIDEGLPTEETIDRHYITKDEVKALIDVLDILGLGDSNLDNFDVNIELSVLFGETEGTPNKDIFLESASIHATITKQLLELGQATLVVPEEDSEGVSIRSTSIAYSEVIDEGLPTEETVDRRYITKDEVKALIDVLDILGLGDSSLDNFDVNIEISILFDDSEIADPEEQNKAIFLRSASIHATMTRQLLDLGDSVLVVPENDSQGDSIRSTSIAFTDNDDNERRYIVKDEIYALIDVLELLGLGDSSLDNFDLDIKISVLFDDPEIADPEEQNKAIFLRSASVHATITRQLIELDDAVLIIPDVDQNNDPVRTLTTAYTEIIDDGMTIEEIDHKYITKEEIFALIDALEVLGLGESSLDNFEVDITLDILFDDPEIADPEDQNKAVFLRSASIHAKVSDVLINETGGNLIIPDVNISNSEQIRIILGDLVYVEKDEVFAIIDALELLGLDDFDNLSFTPANIFDVDFNELLQSASMQATISDVVLENALDETAPSGSGTLIIPNALRETITVDSVSEQQVEKNELINLLEGLKELDISNFDGNMDASTITNLSEAQLNTMLESGSIHITIDNMLKGNPFIQSNTPDLAVLGTLHAVDDVIEDFEIVAFILATQQIADSDFTDVSFDFNAVLNLTPAERSIVLDSMIVRNAVTPDIETLVSVDPGYSLEPEDYEEDDTNNFLRKQAILDFIDYYE